MYLTLYLNKTFLFGDDFTGQLTLPKVIISGNGNLTQRVQASVPDT